MNNKVAQQGIGPRMDARRIEELAPAPAYVH
jgi:hypothetical protein